MSNLKVHISFTDEALPSLVIIWNVGSAKLSLARMGGPAGSYVLDEKKHHSYTTSEGAQRGAERWFKVLAGIFDTSAAKAESKPKQKVVVQQ